MKTRLILKPGEEESVGDGINSKRFGLYHTAVLPEQNWKSL
ncbi:MAG: hypothetical protein PHP95_02810 [Desulfuromonadaceae bacterium]|nr:hypothetical protein [Desulfuromonadaceae bacterium]MDD2847365.1 hypothetical protein [Desulfuromonadaceae bacterium]MDD4131522.1 hypothetical protein [Desulfuromonadaceae bacterium]